MAKLKAPFLSFGATGTVGQALTVSKHHGAHVAKKVPTHPDAQTDAQLQRRAWYHGVIDCWRTLTSPQRAVLRTHAALWRLPAYQYYMKRCLAGGADDVTITLGEGHLTILPYAYHAIGQGTWLPWLSAFQVMQGGIRNTTRADGDNISYHAYLAAGTYTLMLFTYHGASFGIMDIDINGVEVASFDLYNAVAQYNQRHLQADIVIPVSGLSTIRCRAHGKNPASTFFYIPIGYISLWRTA